MQNQEDNLQNPGVIGQDSQEETLKTQEDNQAKQANLIMQDNKRASFYSEPSYVSDIPYSEGPPATNLESLAEDMVLLENTKPEKKPQRSCWQRFIRCGRQHKAEGKAL